ncbi:MAG: hypothetical protein NZM28_04215 [Fimbriimonadales bacterium]|nr:hypothetical protein [Fimbriimonadales bacterium]
MARRGYFTVVVFGVLLLIGWTQGRVEPKVDSESLDASARQLVAAVESAIRQSGGDPERSAIHWVFGFSTGHFASNPSAAMAARGIADRIVQTRVVAGDRVSAFAWEMTVWDHRPNEPRSVEVQDDSTEAKRRLSDLWPLTPKRGSVGGHDTERAIVEIIDQIPSPQNGVLILFTQRAASVAGADGARIIGQNHPDYLKALQLWRRVESADASGASLTLNYRVITPSGEALPRTMDVTLVVPKAFAAPALSQARTERLAQLRNAPTQSASVEPAATRSPLVLVGAIAGALALLGSLAAFALKKRAAAPSAPLMVDVNGFSFTLDNIKGVALTSSAAAPVEDGYRPVTLNGEGLPANEILARIEPKPKAAGVVLRTDYQFVVNGSYTTLHHMAVGDTQEIEIFGESQNAFGAPVEWRARVQVSVKYPQTATR